MISAAQTHLPFRAGDEVLLSAGPYVGTTGVFLQLTADAKWAKVHQHNGSNRIHPVEWLAWHLFKIRAGQS